MTLVAFASIKGSPGVTTLACLVAATWPGAPSPIVVECDPAGGDLAARFELASRCGWPSLLASVRREERSVAIDAHLQRLPGGVGVLVGTDPDELPNWGHPAISQLLDHLEAPGAPGLLVDLGRLPSHGEGPDHWLDHSDRVGLITKGDAASLVALQRRGARWVERHGEKLGLVVVGRCPYAEHEIETFTGIRLMGRLPSDPDAAALAGGEPRRARGRLARSRLVTAATRLATALAGPASPSTASDPHDGAPSIPEPTRALEFQRSAR